MEHPEANIENRDGKQYLADALRNLAVTSRTARGVVDTSASASKSEKMMSGLSAEHTADTAASNFAAVIERLFGDRDKKFQDPAELKSYVEDIARRINAGITREDVLLRDEDSSKFPYTRIADLPAAMEQFYEELFTHLGEADSDPVKLAAWVEYRVDLSDHFFADGCGKTAKAISSWVLMRARHDLPLYRDRKELYQNAPTEIRGRNQPADREQFEKWLAYYRTLFSPKKESVPNS